LVGGGKALFFNETLPAPLKERLSKTNTGLKRHRSSKDCELIFEKIRRNEKSNQFSQRCED